MEQGTMRVCAYCRQEKAWMWNGKRLKDGSKIYVDDKTQRWSGRRCPACERSRVQAAVRCDGFERDIIVRQFESVGYTVLSRALPMKVQKDGKTFTVGVKRAFTANGKVVLEEPVEPGHDLVALVFESVRILPADQAAQLDPHVKLTSGAPAPEVILSAAKDLEGPGT